MIKRLISGLSSTSYYVKSLEFRLNEDNIRVNRNRIKFFERELEFDENKQSVSVPYDSVKIVVEKRLDERSYLIGDVYYKDGCFYIPKDEFPSELERALIDLGINIRKVPEDQIDKIFYY